MFGVNCIPGNVSMFYNLDISPYRPLEEQQQRLRSVMIMIHPDKQNNNNREVILNATSMFQILSPYREILEAEFILERYIKDDREQIQKWDEARTRRMQHRYGGMKPWFFSYNPDPPKWFPNWAVLVDFIHGSLLRCLFFQYVVVGKSKASKSIRNGKALKRRKRRTSRAPYDTPSSENEIDNTVSNQSSQRTLESPECTDFEA
ncbi:predicted protein [Sclerotinia sclerotiorum 1980 UF-70]|uniref:J domain-containing protein n=1 Tax=Sclerotinia sclerotiorum (strain ATCC 18683 / 1980 / Ss-1) TaxID=665079 RepID=A7F3X4_SCLS1|nr:predicted protein [Sclerotinia sclerotiorum 1980 UF-70]EDN97445.1 predicted protein [Sclerotinia sclerotiorum 1980 UF-70]